MSSRWFLIDQTAAQQLTQVTATPGKIISLPLSAVPEQWQRIPGVVSYFASGYIAPDAQPTLTVGGQQILLRTEGDTQKGYRWLFATSSDRNVPVESMFGPAPYSDKK